MGVQVQIQSKGIRQVESVLQSFQQRGGNLRPLLRRIGNILVGGVTKNFEEEGRPKRWKPRSQLTNRIYANQAMEGYARRTEGKQSMRLGTYRRGLENAVTKRQSSRLLIGSSDLKRSIKDRVEGNSVIVGSALPYARIHQLGGVIVPKKAKALMIPTGNGILKLRKVTIPARPYLVATDEEEKLIKNASRLWILEGRLQ